MNKEIINLKPREGGSCGVGLAALRESRAGLGAELGGWMVSALQMGPCPPCAHCIRTS